MICIGFLWKFAILQTYIEMDKKYTEFKSLNLVETAQETLDFWNSDQTFRKSLDLREGCPAYIFYEGPPSANGKPGIHHMLARTIKDIFCRYKTQKGYNVQRKAGWDTHGLPVELGVEKSLGITKEDIGKKISVDDYNTACRKEVMKYKDLWDDLTVKMGYWVDLEHPYITFENEYIETLWHLLSEIYKKGLLYKGYTIQPYSPAAGTGLSSHELNMPGCYRDVKDTTCTAQFRVRREPHPVLDELYAKADPEFSKELFILAWTTTPWTLPSNTALCVGPKIDYVAVETFQPYTGTPMLCLIAQSRLEAYFDPQGAEKEMVFDKEDKILPYRIIGSYKGSALVGIRYEQLFPWVCPTELENGKTVDKSEAAFRVIPGDYVTTEDGTGIVHIAPTFGADDAKVARQSGIPSLLMFTGNGEPRPMVDLKGKFWLCSELRDDFVQRFVHLDAYRAFEGQYVKNAYDPQFTVDGKYDEKAAQKAENTDVRLCIALKQEGKVFKIEKHTHSYPHCWRTDKPVLYYPLDSWFIRTTALKERMIELNNTIRWKPEATGSGRFGNWLENLVDWNLSRSRYWGTPLPIWRTKDGREERCIGSVAELQQEIDKAVEAGLMDENLYRKEKYDLHRPYIDQVVLLSESGQPMYREPDLIDVWFDSGAMPYAQMHYPFEHKDDIENGRLFPADFIAEGVDQTRGWFFTLHAIAVMLFDSVAYRTVISNGLVLDKNGNKMSKRLGNAVDPFETLAKHGPDATRWYMITASQPWENLRFDESGIDEVKRTFFGTLFNTYKFFAGYANIDGFTYSEPDIPLEKRPEIDRWILSELHTLIRQTDADYQDYEPRKAGIRIQNFTDLYLSNWYVRLCRRRFWKGEYNEDKISAYQTLYTCLETLMKLIAPIAPFFSDQLFRALNSVTGKESVGSVHLTDFPKADPSFTDELLEERMRLAQELSSLILSLRKRNNLKVRQPLSKVMVPANDAHMRSQMEAVQQLVLAETNIKAMDFLDPDNDVLTKKIKPNFKILGPKYGKIMKAIAERVAQFTQAEINRMEKEGSLSFTVADQEVTLSPEDVEISTEDIPGWVVASSDRLTVALDTCVTPELRKEGIARELVNRLQNLRKESDLEVTDRIRIRLTANEELQEVLREHKAYICAETLCTGLELVEGLRNGSEIELTDTLKVFAEINKQ